MANTSSGPVPLDFVNANWVPPAGASGSFVSSNNSYASISGLRGRLQAANAAYYTNARLDSLTVNDMVFAVRNIDDPTTIASYMTNSLA